MASTALNHKADVNVDVELSKLDNEKILYVSQYIEWQIKSDSVTFSDHLHSLSVHNM